jgi:ADP-ribose pyrophosphatase YjhB (NUDIX family)
LVGTEPAAPSRRGRTITIQILRIISGAPTLKYGMLFHRRRSGMICSDAIEGFAGQAIRRNGVAMEQTEFKLSAVALVTWHDTILVVRTGYGKELFGKNAFPGAYVRKSEDLEEALKKALLHDVHLRVRVHEIVGITARQRLRGGKTQSICTVFLHATPLNTREMATSAKTHEFKWVPISKILAELSDTARRWLPDPIIDFVEERMR